MKYLNILRDLNVNEDDINEFKDYLKIADLKLKENKVNFKEKNFEITFYNHLISLMDRIRSGEFVEELPAEIMNEVSDKAKEISKSIIEDIFNDYKRTLNESEVFLLSTHIQIAIS